MSTMSRIHHFRFNWKHECNGFHCFNTWCFSLVAFKCYEHWTIAIWCACCALLLSNAFYILYIDLSCLLHPLADKLSECEVWNMRNEKCIEIGSSARKLILFWTMTVDSLLYNLRYILNLELHQHLWSIKWMLNKYKQNVSTFQLSSEGMYLINGYLKEVSPFKLIKSLANWMSFVVDAYSQWLVQCLYVSKIGCDQVLSANCAWNLIPMANDNQSRAFGLIVVVRWI